MSNKNLMRGIYKKFYLFYKLTSIFFYWGFLQFILYKSQEQRGLNFPIKFVAIVPNYVIILSICFFFYF